MGDYAEDRLRQFERAGIPARQSRKDLQKGLDRLKHLTAKPMVRCPECGLMAETVQTSHGWRSQCCGLHSWDGKELASPETHDARQRAHKAFDVIWKTGLVPRSAAYRMLAEELGVPERQAHMSVMPYDLAIQVPVAVDRIMKRLAG